MSTRYVIIKHTTGKFVEVTIEAESLEEAKELSFSAVNYKRIRKPRANAILIRNEEQTKDLAYYKPGYFGEKGEWLHF